MSYLIVESREGHWNYHIARDGETTALCGEEIMPCNTERWMGESESYCGECEEIHRSRTEKSDSEVFEEMAESVTSGCLSSSEWLKVNWWYYTGSEKWGSLREQFQAGKTLRASYRTVMKT